MQLEKKIMSRSTFYNLPILMLVQNPGPFNYTFYYILYIYIYLFYYILIIYIIIVIDCDDKLDINCLKKI